MTKSVKVTLITVVVLVGMIITTLIVIPILFKDRVVELVREQLNEALDATVEFKDVELSLLFTFPTLTVEIVDLRITGKGAFEGKELLSVDSIAVGVDLLTLSGEDRLVVEAIDIERPVIHVLVNEEGAANYEIFKESPEDEGEQASAAEASGSVDLQVRSYRINDGLLTYEAPDLSLRAAGIEHRGSATISGATQTLASETTIADLTKRIGGVTYLKNARLEVLVDALIDTDAQHFEFEKLSIGVNELSLNGSGTIDWTEDAVDLDVRAASGDQQSIKALVSAIPNAYAADFAGLQATGTFSFGGEVKGRLGPDESDFPSFSADLAVDNGTLKYPDLPLPLRDLQIRARASHPQGSLNNTRIGVSKFAMRAGDSHATGTLLITSPLSGPNLELSLKGFFDLAEIAKAYPMPDVDDLTGAIRADIDLATKGENVQRLDGNIEVENVVYRATATPPVKIRSARAELTQKATRISEFRATFGQSDLGLSGSLSPLTTFLVGDQTIRGDLSLVSNRIIVDDFLAEEETTTTQETTPFLIPGNVDASLKVDVKTLKYDRLTLSNFRGRARVRNRKLTLTGVRANALGGSMKLSGTVATPVNKPATFDMDYSVDKMSFAQAFEALPSVQAYAPIARFLGGRFSTNLVASGQLGDDLAPRLSSIDAKGLVVTLRAGLRDNFKPLLALNRAVPAIPKKIDLGTVRTRFTIDKGDIVVREFPVDVKGLVLGVSGRHGLDKQMRYAVTTDLAADKLSGQLAKQLRSLPSSLRSANTVKLKAIITGSIDDPKVKVDLDTTALRDSVAQSVAAEAKKKASDALKSTLLENRKLTTDARKQAAKIRAEAKQAAAKVKREGYKRADQIEEKGQGNPLKARAAREAAKTIRKETDQRAAQLTREADKRAVQVEEQAKRRADERLRRARELAY